MKERRKSIFAKVVLLVVLFLMLEVAAFIYFYLPGGFTALSTLSLSTFAQWYAAFYPTSLIFLVAQAFIIFFLLLNVRFRSKSSKLIHAQVSDSELKSAMRSSKTSLDALYSLLKSKKQLRVRLIAELFEIEPDLAIEWARILEAGDLVVIDYPGMGSPIVRLREEESVVEDDKMQPKEKAKQVVKPVSKKAEEKLSVKDKKNRKKPVDKKGFFSFGGSKKEKKTVSPKVSQKRVSTGIAKPLGGNNIKVVSGSATKSRAKNKGIRKKSSREKPKRSSKKLTPQQRIEHAFKGKHNKYSKADVMKQIEAFKKKKR